MTWSRAREWVSTVALMVHQDNHHAAALYRRFRFVDTGRTEPHPLDFTQQ